MEIGILKMPFYLLFFFVDTDNIRFDGYVRVVVVWLACSSVTSKNNYVQFIYSLCTDMSIEEMFERLCGFGTDDFLW